MARRSSLIISPMLSWAEEEKAWLTGRYEAVVPATTQSMVDSLLRDSFLGNLVPYSIGSAQVGSTGEASFAARVLDAPSVTLSVAQKAAEVLRGVVYTYSQSLMDPSSLPARCLQRVSEGLAKKDIGMKEARAILSLVGETAMVYLMELLERVGERFNQLSNFHFITTNVTRKVLSHVRDCMKPLTMLDSEVMAYLEELGKGNDDDAIRWELSSSAEKVAETTRHHSSFELADATGGFCATEPGVQSSGGVLVADSDDDDPTIQMDGNLRKFVDAAVTWRGNRGPAEPTAHQPSRLPAVLQTPIRRIVEAKCCGRITEIPACLETIIDLLDQYIAGFDDITANLSEKGREQISEGEVVLTLGASHSTLNFFAEASSVKKFDVIILHDGGDSHSTTSIRAAYSLAAALRHKRRNIRVQIHHYSSAYAVMSAVSKVFIGCDQVLSAGGVLAPTGSHPLCVVARAFSVPVVVVTMAIKFIPWYPASAKCMSIIRFAQDVTTEKECAVFSRPTDVLPLRKWDAAGLVGGFGTGTCHSADYASMNPVRGVLVANRTSEYVPPEYITMFVTDEGEFAVSQIFTQMHASEAIAIAE